MADYANDQLLHSRLRALSAGLEGRGVWVMHENAQGVLDISENPPEAWPFGIVLGQPPPKRSRPNCPTTCTT